MAEPLSLDPFVRMRDLLSQLEKGVNAVAIPLLKSEAFAQGAKQAMSSAMVAKKLVQDPTQRAFEALNIPTRTDLSALADRLQAIEDRLLGMQETLDRLAGGSGRPVLPAPARTRKPPQPVIEVAAAAPRRARKAKS